MVEISKKCSIEQSNKLCCSGLLTDLPKNYYQHGITSAKYGGKKVFWYRSIDDVPRNTFSLIVAQEFFDALPIHKFRVSIIYYYTVLFIHYLCYKKMIIYSITVKKVNEDWREILIDVENDLSGTFRYIISNTPTVTSNLISGVCYFIINILYNM